MCFTSVLLWIIAFSFPGGAFLSYKLILAQSPFWLAFGELLLFNEYESRAHSLPGYFRQEWFLTRYPDNYCTSLVVFLCTDLMSSEDMWQCWDKRIIEAPRWKCENLDGQRVATAAKRPDMTGAKLLWEPGQAFPHVTFPACQRCSFASLKEVQKWVGECARHTQVHSKLYTKGKQDLVNSPIGGGVVLQHLGVK